MKIVTKKERYMETLTHNQSYVGHPQFSLIIYNLDFSSLIWLKIYNFGF